MLHEFKQLKHLNNKHISAIVCQCQATAGGLYHFPSEQRGNVLLICQFRQSMESLGEPPLIRVHLSKHIAILRLKYMVAYLKM